jgi:hypothetical protein
MPEFRTNQYEKTFIPPREIVTHSQRMTDDVAGDVDTSGLS